MAYIPHTQKDIDSMLARIGVSSIDALFDEIPNSLRCKALQNIPAQQNEMQMLAEAQKRSDDNQNLCCFVGAGAYEHHIPAAVWDIVGRGEYLTAYTPYQAEASQGTLQLLYEFQTMICALTDMDAANASMYDGASALAEAILMAVRLHKKSQARQVLVPASLHPLYRETIETIVQQQNIELISLPYDRNSGTTDLQALEQYKDSDIAALVIAQPNFFGAIEEVHALTDWAREHSCLSIACVNPVSLGLLAAPGEWGAEQRGVDIVCGEGQPLGVPMASGGPWFGFMATRMEHIRQMPGRIIGRTVDKDGKIGFCLTLQAREQHIRRGKATSNICTNQGLLVTAATIHMSLLGAKGIAQTAAVCHHRCLQLSKKLSAIPKVALHFSNHFFHETVVETPYAAEEILAELRQQGIAGGYPLGQHFPELSHCFLFCTTEMRSEEQLADYAKSLESIMKKREQ